MGKAEALLLTCLRGHIRRPKDLVGMRLENRCVKVFCADCFERGAGDWALPDQIHEAIATIEQECDRLHETADKAHEYLNSIGDNVCVLLFVILKTRDASSELGKLFAYYQSYNESTATTNTDDSIEADVDFFIGDEGEPGEIQDQHTEFNDDETWQTFSEPLHRNLTLGALLDLLSPLQFFQVKIGIHTLSQDQLLRVQDRALSDFCAKEEVTVRYR